MSVRRLAPPEMQPKDFSFSKANLAWTKEQVKKCLEGHQQSAIIPLWLAQEQAFVADFLSVAIPARSKWQSAKSYSHSIRSANSMSKFAGPRRADCAAPTLPITCSDEVDR